MHAAHMRRMPVERARHAKRLGHVVGSNPDFAVLPGPNSDSSTTATATPTQQSATTTSTTHTAPTTTSASQSPSSAPPSYSTTQTSSVPSSAATSSTPSTTGAQSIATDASSSSLFTQPSTSMSISPTPSTPAPQTSAVASGLSGGAIAGIIAGSVIVGVALIVFFIRKTYLRRRELKRISWNGAPGLGAGSLDEPKPFPDTREPSVFSTHENTPPRSAPLSPFEPRGPSMYSAPVSPGVNVPAFSTYGVPAPPPATYNNPTPVTAYPAQAPPSTYGNSMTRAPPGVGVSPNFPMRAQHAPMEAFVKFSFVPTLPDELSITTGERIFIIEQYDDGWNLCANGRGERGMVPRECLESTPTDQLDVGWRNVQRMSSLNSDGRRY